VCNKHVFIKASYSGDCSSLTLSVDPNTIPSWASVTIISNTNKVTPDLLLSSVDYKEKWLILLVNSNSAYPNTVPEINQTQKRNRTWIVTVDKYSYDHSGRLADHYQCIGEGSSYSFLNNSPRNFIDPTGMSVCIVRSGMGKVATIC